MPVYEYRCEAGHVFERILPVAQYLDPQECKCGRGSQKVILRAPRVFGDYEGYESPATGEWVEGRAARRRDLEKSGCRPYEAGEREELVRRKGQEEKETEKLVDVVVEQTMHEMLA